MNYQNIRFNTVSLEDDSFVNIDTNLKNKFIDFINELESNLSIYLCTRGDSYRNREIVSKKILKSIFIVGEKSRLHSIDNDKFRRLSNYNKFYAYENKQDLISDIKKLIQELNDYIKYKPFKERPLKGVFNEETIKQMTNYDLSNDKLKNYKYFLLAFLHNSYKNDNFNKNTPFISLAHGKDKYEIATNFALDYNKEKNIYNKKEGYIFLYCLPKSGTNNEYIITNKLSDAISKMGIKGHYDKYSEIILTNGMYPHFLLGIFKITDSKIKRFTMNPTLKTLLENDGDFDYINGLDINQNNFEQRAKELGYNTYFKVIDGELKIFTVEKNLI